MEWWSYCSHADKPGVSEDLFSTAQDFLHGINTVT